MAFLVTDTFCTNREDIYSVALKNAAIIKHHMSMPKIKKIAMIVPVGMLRFTCCSFPQLYFYKKVIESEHLDLKESHSTICHLIGFLIQNIFVSPYYEFYRKCC